MIDQPRIGNLKIIVLGENNVSTQNDAFVELRQECMKDKKSTMSSKKFETYSVYSPVSLHAHTSHACCIYMCFDLCAFHLCLTTNDLNLSNRIFQVKK